MKALLWEVDATMHITTDKLSLSGQDHSLFAVLTAFTSGNDLPCLTCLASYMCLKLCACGLHPPKSPQ